MTNDNDEDVFRKILKGAERGDARYMRLLGDCYVRGFGVEESEAQAVVWYRKAAEQGDARAQCCIGCCYNFGTGVEKDEARALEWFHMVGIDSLEEAMEIAVMLESSM